MSASKTKYTEYEKFYKKIHEHAVQKAKSRTVTHPYKVRIDCIHNEISFYYLHEGENRWSLKWLFFKKIYMSIKFNLYLIAVDFDLPVDALKNKDYCRLEINNCLLFCNMTHPGRAKEYASITDFYKTLKSMNRLDYFNKSLTTDGFRVQRELFRNCT